MISSHEDKNKDKQRCFLVVRIGGQGDFHGIDSLINSTFNEDPKNLTFDLPQNASIIARRFFEYLCAGNNNKFLKSSPYREHVGKIKEIFRMDNSRRTQYTYNIVTVEERVFGQFSLSDYDCEDDKNESDALYLCFGGPGVSRLDTLQAGHHMLIVELDISPEEFIDHIENKSISLNFLNNKVKGIAIDDRIEYRDRKDPRSNAIHNHGVISINKDRAFAISSDVDIEELKQALSEYLERIERLPSYSDGFWFFKESRSINREANHLLAKKLYDDLSKPNASIEEVFYDLKNKRGFLIHENIKNVDVKRYTDWGIYSDELNNIIRKAGKMVEIEKQPIREPKGHSI